MIGIRIVWDTLIMGFLVLNGKPYARIDQPLMIPDLNKSHPRTSMNKYTVNTVIGFNIAKHFISFGNEKSVYLFVGSHIQRTLKNTADFS